MYMLEIVFIEWYDILSNKSWYLHADLEDAAILRDTQLNRSKEELTLVSIELRFSCEIIFN